MKINNGKYDVAGNPRNGLVREHFKDGSICFEGEYIHGCKTGEWKYILADGNLKAIGRYENDIMIGEW